MINIGILIAFRPTFEATLKNKITAMNLAKGEYCFYFGNRLFYTGRVILNF